MWHIFYWLILSGVVYRYQLEVSSTEIHFANIHKRSEKILKDCRKVRRSNEILLVKNNEFKRVNMAAERSLSGWRVVLDAKKGNKTGTIKALLARRVR